MCHYVTVTRIERIRFFALYTVYIVASYYVVGEVYVSSSVCLHVSLFT